MMRFGRQIAAPTILSKSEAKRNEIVFGRSKPLPYVINLMSVTHP